MFALFARYRPAWLWSDLIAGLLLAAIAIPEQMATARLGGMPAQTGVYAFAAGSLAFAAFGVNRYASVGADSTIASIFAGSVAALAAPGSGQYADFVAAVALFCGVLLAAAGLFRAGWIADFLSIPVTIGFLAGIGVHIVVGQLPLVLGVTESHGPLLVRLVALLRDVPHANLGALTIGVGVFAVTWGAERYNPRIPGALFALVGAGAAAITLRLSERGVKLLGPLPFALPTIRLPSLSFHDALTLLPVAFIVALVCVMQTAAVVRLFPAHERQTQDAGADFTAVGIGCMLSALLGAFAVNASPPRTSLARVGRALAACWGRCGAGGRPARDVLLEIHRRFTASRVRRRARLHRSAHFPHARHAGDRAARRSGNLVRRRRRSVRCRPADRDRNGA